MYRKVSLVAVSALAAVIAAPVLAKVNIQPGLYETTSRVTAISGMGMKPAQIQSILTGKPSVQRQCVTAAKIAKNEWYTSGLEADCNLKDASTPGRISATAQCPSGRTQKITGNYTPTSFNVAVAGGNAQGKMSISMTGKRIGACSGNEDDED